jgi:hypothetical protein
MTQVNISVSQANAEIIVRALVRLPFIEVNALVHYIDKELAQAQKPSEPVKAPILPVEAYAPYGFKVDGTPKLSNGGRPVRKSRKDK